MNDDWTYKVSFRFYDPWEGEKRGFLTWVYATTEIDAIRVAQERFKDELLRRAAITETRVKARVHVE